MRGLHCSLLLLLLLFLTEAKHQPGQMKPHQHPSTPPPTKRVRNRSVPASGELTTVERHRCVWQTSGEVLVKLQVNCTETAGDEQRYWCHYAGKPDLCQVYAMKSTQYWKQLVGKLKKRQNACEGEKVLKAKMCKKAPAEAHMKLAHRSSDVQRIVEKTRGASAGGKTQRRKKTEEEKRRTEFEEEGVMNDMQQQESYCSDQWKSICSFFLKLFEGNSVSQFEVKSNSVISVKQ